MFKKIQNAVRNIPRGKVSSYGSVAKAAGFPGAARQVVWALRQTKDLPWHRVVAAGGRIALPGEAGFEQRMRLESEGVSFSGSRVRMAECEFVFATSAKAKGLTTKDTKVHKGKSETMRSKKPSPQTSQKKSKPRR
jgi:methylated-DNA-protein-cysteine methyltransferase-like protein